MSIALTPDQIQQLKTLFSKADSLIFSAGAGMGVDSGLPDFRGNQGMWKVYPELGRKNFDFTQIANPAAFRSQPHLTWGFYGHRLALYRKTQPHQGFQLLKQLAEQLNVPYFVFTSNVDGQFQKAGFDPKFIYECHGSIHHIQCLNACTNEVETSDTLKPQINSDSCQWLGNLPKCLECGGLMRPNILMFNDATWISTQSDQQDKRLKKWLNQYRSPLVIEIGAGTAIPSVRMFSEQFSPHLLRINPREAKVAKNGGMSLPYTALIAISLIFNALITN